MCMSCKKIIIYFKIRISIHPLVHKGNLIIKYNLIGLKTIFLLTANDGRDKQNN